MPRFSSAYGSLNTGLSMTGLPSRRSASHLREVSGVVPRTRRDFLRDAAGVTLGSTLLRSSWARAVTSSSRKKVVVVTFGGGARDQETFAPEGQENIPHLMRELTPQATFFTQVV